MPDRSFAHEAFHPKREQCGHYRFCRYCWPQQPTVEQCLESSPSSMINHLRACKNAPCVPTHMSAARGSADQR
eukprot:8142063-Karenia_brevis.AAC.1